MTLTRYRKFVPRPTEQVAAALLSGVNDTNRTESSKVSESASTYSFAGKVNFQP
jgi:hypothetical protein